MRFKGLLAAFLMGLGVWAAPAQAAVSIQVDLSSQTMHVTTGSGEVRDWPVSTARAGFVTPRGHYGVQSLQAMHYSHKYHNSPMPHSIFFHGGYAIHGTYATGALGRAASHGCVRLSPDHAAELFQMVRAEGASISIIGNGSGRGDVQVARRHHGEQRFASNRHHRGHDRVYASRRYQPEAAPLAYAPVRVAPSYGDWTQNPFGSLTDQ